MQAPTLLLAHDDAKRLQEFIGLRRPHAPRQMLPLFDRLDAELQRIEAVQPEALPADVVTMNSTVVVADLDTGETITFTLAWPDEADADENRISVLAPLGMAVLGYRVGATVEWPVPAGLRRLRIQEVLFQPEAASNGR